MLTRGVVYRSAAVAAIGLVWIGCRYADAGLSGREAPQTRATEPADVGRAAAILDAGGDEAAMSVAFSPDGRHLAAGYDGATRIWEWRTGKQGRLLTGHKGSVLSLAFSPDGKKLLTADAKGTVRLWEATSGKLLKKLDDGRDSGHGLSVLFSQDGKTVFASIGKTVYRWSTSSGALLSTFSDHPRPIVGMALSKDGKSLWCCYRGSKSHITHWRVADGTKHKPIPMARGDESYFYVTSGHFLPGRKLVVLGRMRRGLVDMLDMGSGERIRSVQAAGGVIMDVGLSPDGRVVAAARNDFPGTIPEGEPTTNVVYVWQADTGKLLARLWGHSSYIRSIVFSSDGRFLASGGFDATVRVWRVPAPVTAEKPSDDSAGATTRRGE